MTIADQINRLNNAKAAIKQSITNKGVSVNDSALLDEYPALIDRIEVGEGGGPNPYQELYMQRTANGTSMRGLFAHCNVPELDLRNMDVSKVTDMGYIFYYCSSNVNIDGWDISKLTNTSYMFNYFTGSIDISKLNFSNVTSATYMFSYANTNKINLVGLSFPKTTSLANMFNYAEGTILDLTSWDISNITNMSSLFNGTKFKKIDLTGWKTTNVTNMGSTFSFGSSCPTVELIIPDWDMTNVTSSSSFFPSNASYTAKLMLIDLSRSNDTTITKIASYLPTRTTTTYGRVMIPAESSQAAIDALIAKYWRPVGPRLDLISCEVVPELDEILPNKSTKLYSCNCEPWYGDDRVVEFVSSDESVATIEGDVITSTGVVGTTEITARNKETLEILSEPLVFAVSETDNYPNVIKFRGTSTPGNSHFIYVNGTSSNKVLLSKMDYNSVSGIYTYDVGAPITSIRFNGQGASYTDTCTEVVKINTSNMTSMQNMFNYCSNLTSLDLSSFDTSNVTSMERMFNNCSQLTELNLSNFDTSNVTTMDTMFYNCTSLTEVDVSNFDTSNVAYLKNMFENCGSLTSLNLSSFETRKIIYISSMFKGCSSLQELDIRNFTVAKGGDYAIRMFEGCESLHTLRLDNCNNTTISNIITSTLFPTNAIDGVTRKIYCKEENAAGLIPPTNWVFEFVESDDGWNPGGGGDSWIPLPGSGGGE